MERSAAGKKKQTTTNKPIKINPETNNEEPATSSGEWIETSLAKKRTPIANPNADIIASISPKVTTE